jgi:glycosyltransferase involved in cell wall biosynthesis
MSDSKLLSVVLTSYTTKRLNDIYELLDSIKCQSYGNIEIIFVTESSVELFDSIKRYAVENEINNIKVVINAGETGLSAARNFGVKESHGDIVAFIDDDAILYPDWAEQTVKSYEEESVIGITGPAFPLWEDESMSWFPEEFYWIISCTAWTGWKQPRDVRNAWGMNMSFRREVFDSGEFFTSTFGLHNNIRSTWYDPPSEDVDLSLRVKKRTGKRIVFVPSVRIKHRVYLERISGKFIRQRSFSVGYQRRILKKLFLDTNTNEDLLGQEHQLLKNIFSHLFPEIAKGFFPHPRKSYRKLVVTATVLTFVSAGYYSYFLNLGGIK